MATFPLCPHCSAPMIDAGDLPTFQTEGIATGLPKGNNSLTHFWAVSCGKCGKLLGILPVAPTRIQVVRR